MLRRWDRMGGVGGRDGCMIVRGTCVYIYLRREYASEIAQMHLRTCLVLIGRTTKRLFFYHGSVYMIR